MSDNTTTASETGNMGFIVLICLVATLGGFLFGFDSGVINGTVKGLDAAFGATNFASGLNVASMLLGCAAGAFFCRSFVRYVWPPQYAHVGGGILSRVSLGIWHRG